MVAGVILLGSTCLIVQIDDAVRVRLFDVGDGHDDFQFPISRCLTVLFQARAMGFMNSFGTKK